MFEDHKEEMRLWAQEKEKNDIIYPSEAVVRYLHNNFSSGKGKKILDFGCGTGRNTIVMANMEFEIYAMDYNDICLQRTREKINYKNITYLKNERTSIPVESDMLDCIVAWGALFYCNEEDRNRMFLELNRILKQGGVFLSDFRTTEDYLCGKGKLIEKGYYILEEYRPGMNYWFCDEDDLRDLYKRHGFAIVNMEKEDFYRDNMEKTISHYHVWAKKEKNCNV